MNWKLALTGVLILTGLSAGCATMSDSGYPSASPATMGSAARTDAPQIDNADAAGVASVPGTHTGAADIIVPAPPAASPVIIVPPPAESPVIVVPPSQPR